MVTARRRDVQPRATEALRVRRIGLILPSLLALVVGACGSDSPSKADPVADPPAGTEPSKAPPQGAQGVDAVAVVRVHYPVGSRKIELVGERSPLAWDKPTALVDAKDDTWELVIGKTDSPLAFKPLLDSKPARGPNYVVHPGQTLDIFPHFEIEHGTISILQSDFESKKLGNKRAIRMYLPPSYDENTVARYPVIYMHDGQNLFTKNLTSSDSLAKAAFKSWDIDKSFDEGIESGALPEAIAIGVDAIVDATINPLAAMDTRNSELTPTKDDTQKDVKNSGKGPDYIAMIIEEVKPLVDGKLRTRPERESTYMAGSSLGGLMSSWTGIEHGDVFVAVASLSGSNFWDHGVISQMAKSAKVGLPHADKVYLDVGAKETTGSDDTKMMDGYKQLLQAYLDAGYVDGKTLMTTVDPVGEHNGDFWSKRFPATLAFLLGPGR